jgi:4-hydroxy-tetrahydrodipicolinate synthase
MSTFNFPVGVHTVLVTPFIDSNCDIDYEEIVEWLNSQSTTGVAGLVLLGSTSESSMLSREEKMDIVKIIHMFNNQSPNPKFITVGISVSNDIREVIDFAVECSSYCNAFMLTVPNYVKPPARGMVNWFKTICCHPKLSHMPFVLYNIPGRACINMLPETMKEVCDLCPNVVAIKEASGSLEQMKKVIDLLPNVKLFSGDDGLTIDVIKLGGVGVISVASNVFPELMATLTKYCLDSEYDRAINLSNDTMLESFITALFCESNPIPVKFMLNKIGLYKSYQMRQPLEKLDDSKQEQTWKALFTTNEKWNEYVNTTDKKSVQAIL